MNISIFGLGHVGCVSLGCLARNGHTLIGVDTNETKVSKINSGVSPVFERDIDHIIREEHGKNRIYGTKDYCKAILETELSIVAVEVPFETTGHADLQKMFKVAETFGRILRAKNELHVIAIRSNVPPGTAEKFAAIIEEYSGKKRNADFAIVSNPQFLRKGTAVEDYYHPPVTLIGSEHAEAAEKVASLYRNLPAEIIIAGVKAAELMKYVNNSFHALKISFANEIAAICSSLKIDPHEVMDILCADKKLNISDNYLKPGFAYGGSGLRKNLKGLRALAHDHYIETPLLESIDKSNKLQIDRAIDIIKKTKKNKLGFLGLSFKAGTDDLSNSSTVTLIEILLGKGYEIAIYDSNVNGHKEYIDAHIPHLSGLIKLHISDVMHESELIVVANKEKEYTDVLMNVEMEHPVIGLVRLPDEIRQKKNYTSIN
jgi:GDP-mannose 6-dehydrogenase